MKVSVTLTEDLMAEALTYNKTEHYIKVTLNKEFEAYTEDFKNLTAQHTKAI